MPLHALIVEQSEWESLMSRMAFLEKSLADLKQQPIAIEWVTVEQAAKYLHRHKDTVRGMCKSGELNYRQGKRKIEISLASIRDYCDKHGVKWND